MAQTFLPCTATSQSEKINVETWRRRGLDAQKTFLRRFWWEKHGLSPFFGRSGGTGSSDGGFHSCTLQPNSLLGKEDGDLGSVLPLGWSFALSQQMFWAWGTLVRAGQGRVCPFRMGIAGLGSASPPKPPNPELFVLCKTPGNSDGDTQALDVISLNSKLSLLQKPLTSHSFPSSPTSPCHDLSLLHACVYYRNQGRIRKQYFMLIHEIWTQLLIEEPHFMPRVIYSPGPL